ncbi:MAG: CHAT domain-containing protein [Gemmatimonadota bacterium]
MDKLEAAARRAIEVNPDNAMERRSVARSPIGRRGGPRRIAVVVARKWPATGVQLSVSFMDNPSRALRTRILKHMNAWSGTANVLFTETEGVGQVRIARFDAPVDVAGHWSYLGTEILEQAEDEPTLNLESFTMKTSEAEFRRVVRHEAGHTLGFDHEHMRSDIVKRIDRTKAFAFFDRDQGWSREETEEQVLTPLSKRSLMGTKESDPLSIMCYQLPGKIMKDRKPVPGGLDINPTDFAFAAKLYPKPGSAPVVRAPVTVAPVSAIVVARHEEVSGTFEIVVLDELDSGTDQRRAGGKDETPEFAQVFASFGGARVMAPMRLRASKQSGKTGKQKEKTLFSQIITEHDRIRAYTNRQHGSLPDDAGMIAFGTNLFNTLFQGDVRRLYDEARTREKRRLDLVLTSMIPWIAEKPWEFAHDAGRNSFLATEEIHFIRNVLTNIPADPIVRTEGPLRILVASAQPVGYGRLSIEQETAVIRRGFDDLIAAGLVVVDVLARATPSHIHEKLQTGNYQVVHFIGHGVYDEDKREGCLIFVGERGDEYPLGQRSVREIFCGRGLSLVFLNACESGRGGRADFNKGVAQSMVAHGLPALVANQYSVLDSSATSFAQHFYWSLAQGMSLGQSAREARIAVNYSLHGEPIDWAVPVLYARDSNMALCTAPASRRQDPATGVRSTTRRSTTGRAARIAVWDMDYVFPSLEQTLETMNRVQSVFGFELAHLSVPLGVWDFEEEEEVPYLWAERLAQRLQSTPMELGVEVLACVTRHWMRDNEYFNIYGWWPDDGKPPIQIFSVAGFDRLAPEGPETNRAITNALVAGLAGFYSGIGTHERGAKDCPFAFNQSRDFDQIVGRQKFDAGCRRKLKAAKLGSKLDALDALLKAFS